MCDREGALRTMVDAAVTLTQERGEWVAAVQEKSTARESQPNGRAERSVQRLEDHVRTIKAVLEVRIGKRIPNVHPIVRWMIEHSATTLNKYAIHDTGDRLATAYELLHGTPAHQKIAESGERVLFWIPKARRGKLVLKWSCGRVPRNSHAQQ